MMLEKNSMIEKMINSTIHYMSNILILSDIVWEYTQE